MLLVHTQRYDPVFREGLFEILSAIDPTDDIRDRFNSLFNDENVLTLAKGTSWAVVLWNNTYRIVVDDPSYYIFLRLKYIGHEGLTFS